jgi:coenzyme PQQ synthesis protein D (PqqD)
VTVSTPGASLVHYLPTDRFRPSAHVVWARQTDAIVLLDGDRGLYYTLNEVASDVWELVVGGEPMMEIVRCIEQSYDVAVETIRVDVEAVLKLLLDTDLIERVSP